MSFLHVKLRPTKSGSRLLPDFRVRELGGYYVVGTEEDAFIKLRVRADYPITYAHQLDDQTVLLGYGPPNPQPNDEFLQIILDGHGTISVKRDVFATLPLFNASSEDIFVLSNDYTAVLNDLPAVTLSPSALFDALIPNSASNAAFWKEISILDERQVLEWDGHSSVVHQPEVRQWASSRQAGPNDPQLFRAVFANYLDAFADTFLNKEGFAFEVSGGIDSATLPLSKLLSLRLTIAGS